MQMNVAYYVITMSQSSTKNTLNGKQTLLRLPGILMLFFRHLFFWGGGGSS